MSLFEELKRRNVFRVGAAYAVVGWVLVQVAGSLEEALSLPQWFDTVVVAFLGLGLPVALFLAWAYELTPEGLKPEEDAPAKSTGFGGRKLDMVIIAGLVVALSYFVWERQASESPPEETTTAVAEADRPTIAVLPFVNMSTDPAQEFFSDGMTEEILNMLVKERALKVVSRTSVFSIKGQNLDIPTIAAQLGATYIVEGSVRRAGETLRITAQLIEAASDTHLWSETYDRPHRDVFAVQEEIAGAISAALGESLGFTASATVSAERIEDMAAYEDFLRAKALLRDRQMGPAGELFESVIDRAPDYAPAWSHYAVNQAYKIDIAIEQLSGPEEVVATLGSARWATAQAVRLAPNDAMTIYAQGMLARIEGRAADEITLFKAALEVDPENPLIREDYVESLNKVWLFEQARPLAEELVALDPAWYVAEFMKGAASVSAGGIDDFLARADASARKFPEAGLLYSRQFEILLAMGRWQEAESVRQRAIVNASKNNPLQVLVRRMERVDLNAVKAWVEDPNRLPLQESGLLLRENGEGSGLVEVAAVLQTNDPDEIFATAKLMSERKFRRFGKILHLVPEFHYLWATPQLKDWIRHLERKWNFSMPTAWRQHGWPEFCRPLGDDDFECSAEFGK